jgi:hypothetical protein
MASIKRRPEQHSATCHVRTDRRRKRSDLGLMCPRRAVHHERHGYGERELRAAVDPESWWLPVVQPVQLSRITRWRSAWSASGVTLRPFAGRVFCPAVIPSIFPDLLTFPWVGSTASIGHFWAAADAAGRSLTCPLPAQRVHRGSRVKGGRRPSQRDALAPLTREGCTRRRRGPDLHARMGTQSRCSEIDPRKRHKRWEWALARPLAGG